MSFKALERETELLVRLARGDERAFEILYYHYSPRLFPFVDKMVRNRRITEEIIQDVFMLLWTNRSHIATVQHPTSYIFSIASHKTLDYQRKIASDKRLLEKVVASAIEFQNETEEQLIYKESAALIKQAVATLPERRRMIYELSRIEGLNHDQIAERLGISRSTVANQMVSALKYIRSFLEKRSGVFSYAIFFFLTSK
ncbi:RNA polymerase sigma-70 factor [Pedobacter sp. MC2016-14]|uniref:RNA polymerase sigma factor n=1 Tax=Pedobacter sp. MC2016-14 TaxID=2897327 RepID=UPI001E54F372|nr:RNA polymerase sigma-70 factor [Pedobacter sp. MC2016-14]MCD0488611.1 RNA polymerase sigma-70 factor [Pedobacter sp. MC2016-14]